MQLRAGPHESTVTSFQRLERLRCEELQDTTRKMLVRSCGLVLCSTSRIAATPREHSIHSSDFKAEETDPRCHWTSWSILSSLWRSAFPWLLLKQTKLRMLVTPKRRSLLHGLRMVQQIFVHLDSLDSEAITTCFGIIESTSAFFVSMIFLAIRAFSCVDHCQVDKNLESRSRAQLAFFWQCSGPTPPFGCPP